MKNPWSAELFIRVHKIIDLIFLLIGRYFSRSPYDLLTLRYVYRFWAQIIDILFYYCWSFILFCWFVTVIRTLHIFRCLLRFLTVLITFFLNGKFLRLMVFFKNITFRMQNGKNFALIKKCAWTRATMARISCGKETQLFARAIAAVCVCTSIDEWSSRSSFFHNLFICLAEVIRLLDFRNKFVFKINNFIEYRCSNFLHVFQVPG